MGKFFTEREIRAVAVFLPLAGLLVLGIVLVRPKADPAAALRVEAEMEERADTVVMQPFDPNTVDYDGLRRLGLTKHEAVSLLKYRAAGKIFRIPEDVTLCYGISDSLFTGWSPTYASGASMPSLRRSTARGASSPSRCRPRRSASTR